MIFDQHVGFVLTALYFWVLNCSNTALKTVTEKFLFFLILDIRPSELYSEPDVANIAKPPVRDDYAEPVDSLQPGDNPDELVANPIYEGIYSEPLYGIAGTILVGPQVMLVMPWCIYIFVFY